VLGRPSLRPLPFRVRSPAAFCLSPSCPPLALRRLVGPPLALRRQVGRRRRKPGAEAFVGLLAGDEHPLGIPTPSLPFMLCEAEHRNPNLKLFSYLTSLLTYKFLQKFTGSVPVHYILIKYIVIVDSFDIIDVIIYFPLNLVKVRRV
jgi:hypothetical protein